MSFASLHNITSQTFGHNQNRYGRLKVLPCVFFLGYPTQTGHKSVDNL